MPPRTTPRQRQPSAVLRWRRMRRAVLARRRLVAATLAGLAVLTGVRAAAAPPEATAPVLVARADLAGGRMLAPQDFEVRGFSPDAVPDGAFTDPEALGGRLLAAPVRRGEPVTDVRLVSPGLLDGYPGTVAAPVRVADAGAVRLLTVGDRLDLVATRPDDGSTSTVARGVPVVALPPPVEGTDGLTAGGLVVVAVDRTTAVSLAGASVSSVLSIVLTG